MIKVLGFLIAMGFATGVAAQDCAFFCEVDEADGYYDFFTVENVQKLLAEGANIEERDENGNTLLALAVQSGNLEMFQMLVDAGADIQTENGGKITLLHHAVMTSQIALNDHEKWGYYVGSKEEYLEIINILVDADLDVDAISNLGNLTPLWVSVYFGTSWTAEALIVAGADTESKGVNGWTPLHLASTFHGKPDLVETLVLGGANVNAVAEDGSMPLHDAAMSRPTGDLAVLVTHGSDVNAQNLKGQTPLMFTTDDGGREENARYLLSVGADPNLQTLTGWTALHYTVDSAPALIIPLLEGGADATIRNKDGQTAFDLIRENPDLIGTAAYLALEAASE